MQIHLVLSQQCFFLQAGDFAKFFVIRLANNNNGLMLVLHF